MTKRLFLILASLIFCVSVYAQITNPPYKVYTLRDGLPQMQIWSMFQDSRRYLWIGTKGGISRFDGEKFTNYSQIDGLADNRVDRIYEDFSGKIWIVTRFGISYFDGQKIKTFPHIHSGLYLAPALDGKIWYSGTLEATPAKAIFGYIENDRFYNLIDKYPELSIEPSGQIAYSAETQSLIISTTKNVYELKGESIRKLLENVNNPEIKVNNSTISIYDWKKQNHLNIFEYKKNKAELVATLIDGSYAGQNRPRQMHILKVYSVNSKLYWLKSDTVETIDFPGKWINLSFIDNDNRLWIGTEEGLYKLYPGGFETYQRDALPMVWSMVEDKQQNMWFASHNLGIRKLDGDSILHYPAESIAKYGSLFYYQAQVDDKGTLYFPNYNGVLWYNGKSFGKIGNGFCPACFYDSDRKQLLVGSHKRIEVFDLNHQKISEIGPDEGIQIKGWFAAFDKDIKGNLWAGGGTGLVRVDGKTGTISNYTRSNGKLSCDGVSCIYQPPVGNIWFGGTQGLLWYDEKKDSVCLFKSPEIQDAVNLVSSIDSTWLLFSQPNGIYLLDLKKFRKENKIELHLFNDQNGFIGLEPGQNGAVKDSKGNIWMTTGTEVVKLNPKELDLSKNKINVRISGFNGTPLLYHQKEIVLPRNERTAVIQFETICFNRPKSAKYSYRINGEGKEWSAWQDENYAVLTALEDGKSEVQVRTRIPGLPDSEAIVTMPLVISLALWKQDWFFPGLLGLVSLLVILSMALFVQTRTRLLEASKQAKTFQLQAILSQLNPHFIFNVMATIQSEILSANIQRANDYLVKMSDLIRGFLEASVSAGFSKSKNIKDSELKLQKEIDVLNHFIQFQQFVFPNRFQYELVVEYNVDLQEVSIPPMLIQPFVENSIKHGLLQKTGKGKLKITFKSIVKNELIVEIEDDGIGIERADALKHNSQMLYTSRGKELTLRRIKLLNEIGYCIQYKIDSSDDGTKITLKIRRDGD